MLTLREIWLEKDCPVYKGNNSKSYNEELGFLLTFPPYHKMYLENKVESVIGPLNEQDKSSFPPGKSFYYGFHFCKSSL